MKRHPFVRLAGPLVAGLATLSIAAGSVMAHGPDPSLGGTLWAQDQVLFYGWKTGQVPPSWMIPAIDAAAADASITRSARAATFARPVGAAASLIAYGEPTGCTAAGIACFDRSGAPSSFRMWFRAHGYVFDWGTLRWCQGLATIANGCFDAENVALDEFGHVDVLNHHLNQADGSDYLDAVVQTVARARPDAGWNAHALGRCDTARLQLEYDRLSYGSLFSSCLAIPTTTSLAASVTSLSAGSSVRFTATLMTTSSTANRALASDPVSARTVTLQRRTSSTGAWSGVGAMTPSTTTAGTYSLSVSPTATYEWRAVFTPATGDGALGSASVVVKVTVGACTGTGCPSLAVP
jgi:hypothetical protein